MPKTLYQINHLKEIYQNRMLIRGNVEHIRHLYKEGEVVADLVFQFNAWTVCFIIHFIAAGLSSNVF